MSLARPAEDLSWAVGLRLSLECALLLPVSQTLDETVLRVACQAIPDIWFVMESDDRQRLRLCLFGWNQYCRTYQPHQPEVESAMMAVQAVVLRGVAAVHSHSRHSSSEKDDGDKFPDQAPVLL